jgi:hypothetical protein
MARPLICKHHTSQSFLITCFALLLAYYRTCGGTCFSRSLTSGQLSAFPHCIQVVHRCPPNSRKSMVPRKLGIKLLSRTLWNLRRRLSLVDGAVTSVMVVVALERSVRQAATTRQATAAGARETTMPCRRCGKAGAPFSANAAKLTPRCLVSNRLASQAHVCAMATRRQVWAARRQRRYRGDEVCSVHLLQAGDVIACETYTLKTHSSHGTRRLGS